MMRVLIEHAKSLGAGTPGLFYSVEDWTGKLIPAQAQADCKVSRLIYTSHGRCRSLYAVPGLTVN